MRPAAAPRSWLRIASLAALTLVTVPVAAAPSDPAPRVYVIVSQEAEPYRLALDGLRDYLQRHEPKVTCDVIALKGDAARVPDALSRARAGKATLIVTLGSLATGAAIGQLKDLPIVAGLVLSQDDLDRAPNATGVVLEFPAEVELRWMQKLLPHQKRVGVLFNPAENQGRITAATRAAKQLGLTLNARSLDSPTELPDALEAMTRHADVLWGVADQVALTPQTAQPILLFSFRNRIPFVGLSLPWVKAGAVYALDRDYTDIGSQCGEMALKVLHGTPPSALPPVPPRKVVYSINLRAARHLKIDIPQSLLDGARNVVE
jgi:putative tryptophan/tyrosine transport system substrate-binding protein